MGLLETIRQEWGVIRSAPWSIAGLFALGLSIGFAAATFIYSREVAAAKQEASAAQADRQLFEHRLSERQGPPPQALGPPHAEPRFQEIEAVPDRRKAVSGLNGGGTAAASEAVSVQNSPGSIIGPKGGTNTVQNGVREPGSIYQNDVRVGTGVGPVFSPNRKSVTFAEIRFTGAVDASKPLEYGAYLIRCAESPAVQTAAIFLDLVENDRCEIVGRR